MSKKENNNPQFVNGEIYHVISRAVGDTVIFKNEDDFYRGIFSIYEFNNSELIEIWRRRRDRVVKKHKEKLWGVRHPTKSAFTSMDKRDKFVEILAFCFMPNHIHLLVRQLKDDGISQFMKKVGGGYANYFNKKYNRKGHLFNKFKAVHISSDDQLRNIFAYIHCNPISLIEPGWKEKYIRNTNKVMKFLKGYKWSSYPDYIGTKNFPSVISKDLFYEIIGGPEKCKETVLDWIKYKNEINFGTDKIFLE